MEITFTADQLHDLGLAYPLANQFTEQINLLIKECTAPEEAWHHISKQLLNERYPFNIHLFLFTLLFPTWREHPETAPAWLATKEIVASANIYNCMLSLNIPHIKAFYQWTIDHYQEFWPFVIQKLGIIFNKKPNQLVDLSQGVESPHWFPSAKMNIVDSCFTAPPSTTALLYQDQEKNICKLSYDELNRLSNRIANSLLEQGLKAGDAIAIAMPMDFHAVAIYLGIIKMGGIVISIADSFSSQEIATRLNIAKAKAIFTQDFILRADKKLPLYKKVSAANAPRAIVLSAENHLALPLREGDCAWKIFLTEQDEFLTVSCEPMAPCNILFSSGTTGEPKAIVWNHTTPIKAASDAYFHQNIQPNDILAWPTNLGWMMGPWLIFAALINKAAIALYEEPPKDRAFGEFIERAHVTMLGVVPTLVATWRQTNCMQGLDWHAIKVFSSTGECSNPEDMLFLMSLAQYKPIIEYCGGTEIGGAYISSTVIENNYPSVLTAPTMGLNMTILDENGHPSHIGEVAIIPPSLGLSTTLLNADHHQVYFASMPKTADGKVLRRHGDQIKQFANGYYSVLGRVDDTMNLGGIKTSAVEIERVLSGLPAITEVAAIAVSPPDNGPSQLIIYAVATATLDKQAIMKDMQNHINTLLNPLFKIYDVVFIDELPKTASNKIMRRLLRKEYQEKRKQK